ncbi:MAG TPA: PQQ-binding-like beta-propeller repeat protein [Thermoanaerobaculia bacterium]|nr:PQQ-binding-like beta-propeller repeat protein [Thermoanaerobaculia bacterium]
MPTTTNWWMFHGDTAHTGEVTDSPINSSNVAQLKNTFSLDVPGSILSTPAVADGYIYVGLANASASKAVPTGIGGTMLKVNIQTGVTEASYSWSIDKNERDSHGFTGMGCTPAVVNGKVYFIAFNGVLFCLNAADLSLAWQTNLRWADLPKNQPVNNVANYGQEPPTPQAAGWSSPCIYDGKVWVGIGEGENPNLYSFVYCLDAATGNVIWIFCTNQYVSGMPNQPNVLPSGVVIGPLKPPFSSTPTQPITLGCSVWSSPAYDPELDILYCTTGNPVPDGELPSLGYSVGLLALKGSTGEFVGFAQFPPESSYRVSDIDVDVGGAPTLYSINGRKVVGLGCKNGSYMICDAQTIDILKWRQMLPKMNDGTQIPTVDPHAADANGNALDSSIDPNPFVPNDISNKTQAENFHGTYSTAALCTPQKKLFIGVGGNNYHFVSSGIDSQSTPFMRAMDWETLDDAWPMAGDPMKYTKAASAMYRNAGESGISVPAVVNDVVFMATTQVALYAFSATDGTLLWNDMVNFGQQTGGFMGGYGYCLGPAIWNEYIVAGALVSGGTGGGVLNIYKLG